MFVSAVSDFCVDRPDLYRSGDVGREIARLKARSKHVEQQRTDTQARRSEYDETLEGGHSEGATPNLRGSRNQLAELEQEERAFLEQWRSLREKGKRLRIEEERLEQETVPGRSEPDDQPLPTSLHDVFPDGHKAWVYFSYRFLRRFAKGFAFGYFGKFAFAFIGLAMRHKANLPKLIPAMAQLVLKRELWGYGAFLGSFLTLFESSIRLLKMKSWLGRTQLVRHHRSVRVIISAAVAAGAAMTFLPADTRLGISTFFCVRALEILVRWCVEREEKRYDPPTKLDQDRSKERVLQLELEAANAHKHGVEALAAAAAAGASPLSTSSSASSSAAAAPSNGLTVVVDTSSSMTLPAPSMLSRVHKTLKRCVLRVAALPASEHFDVLVMSVASGFAMWAWLFNRQTVEPAYLRFLDFQGGRTKEVQYGFVQLHHLDGIEPSVLDAINATRSSEGRGLLDTTLPLPRLMCTVLHRHTESCALETMQYFRLGLLRALPVYLPVYIIPMLLFKHRQLLRRPLQVLLPTLANLARSTLFLSSYCTVCWGTACASTNLGLTHQVKGALAGFMGGLMVLIEKKGRRVELALYVLSQALPAAWRTLVQWGVAPQVPHGEVITFIASMSVIMWSYVTRPHLMRSSYLSLFLWFFGSGGRAAGFSLRALEHSTPKAIEDTSGAAAAAKHMHLGGQHRLNAYTEPNNYSFEAENGAPVRALAPPSLASAINTAATVAAASLVPSPQDILSSSPSAAAASSLSPPSPPVGFASPGALTMQSRHTSRLSTVHDESEEAGDSTSPSPTPSTSPPASPKVQ